MSWRPLVFGYTPLDPTNRKQTLKSKYSLGSNDSGRGVSPHRQDSNQGTFRSSKELSEVDFSTISQVLARNLPLKISQKKEEEFHQQSDSAEVSQRSPLPGQNSELLVPLLSLRSLNPTPRPASTAPTPVSGRRPTIRPPRGKSLITQKRSVLTKLNKKERETIRPIPLDSPVQQAIHLRSYENVSESDTLLPDSSNSSESEAGDLVAPVIYVKEPTYQQIDIEGRFISVPEYEESFNTHGFSTISTDSRYVLDDIPDLELDQAHRKYNEHKKVAVHVKKRFKESRNRLKKLASVISDDSEEDTNTGVPKVKTRLPREGLDVLVPYDRDRYVDVKKVDTNVKLPQSRLKKQAVHSQRKQLRSEPQGGERDHLIKRLEEKNANKNRARLVPVGFDSQSEQDKDHIRTETKTLKSRLDNLHKKHQRLIPIGYDTEFDNRLDGHLGQQKSKPLDYYSDLERKPRRRQQKKPTRQIVHTKPKQHFRRIDIVQETSDQESINLSRPPRYPIRRSRKPLEDARHQPIPHKLFDEYGREYIVRHSRLHTFAPSDLNDYSTAPHKPPATHNRAGIVHANDLLPAHPIPSAPVGPELKSSSHAIPVSSHRYVFYNGDNKIYVAEDYLHNSKGSQQKFDNAKVNFERRLKDHIHEQQRDASYDLRRKDSNSLHFKMDDYNNHTEISPYALEKLSAKKFFKEMGRLPDEKRMDGHYRKDRPSKDYNLRGQRGMPPIPLPRSYSDERGYAGATPDPVSRGFSRGTYSGNAPLDQSASIQGDTSVDPSKNQIHIYSYGPLNISSGTVPKGDVNESVPENPNEKGTSTHDINQKSGTGHFLAQGQGRDGYRYVNEDLNSSGNGTEGTPQNNEHIRTDLSWRKKNSAESTKKNVYVVKTPLHDKNTSLRPPTHRSTSQQVQELSSPTKEIPRMPEKVVADSETQKYEPGSLEDIKQKVREIWHELGPVQPEEEEEEEKKDELMEDMYFDHDEEAQYVISLVTDDGGIIGPFSMEIDDVQIGFGKMLLERHPELMTVPSEEEEKQDREETEKPDEVEIASKQQPQVGVEEGKDKKGLRNRISSPNDMNEFSSRSHTMLQLMIDNEIPDPDDENLYITKHGKLTFVDLAGSEKVKDSTIISGEFMAETNNINKSLLVLGNCISALADSKKRSGHIPYRDSKLTKLLADSIGGSGVTLMIACVSPSSQNTAETMNTLRYANRAKKIKNKPIVKMDPREKLILTLKRELKILRQENHYLRQQLNFPEKPRGKLQKENDEQFLKLMKQNARKSNKDRDKDFKSEEDFDQIPLASAILPPAKTMPITDSTVQTPNTSDGPSDLGKPPPNPDGSGLYEMLQEYMVENETLRSENNDLQGFKDKTRRDQQNLSHENERLQRRLEEIERLLSSEAPNRFASIEPQYPYSDPNVTARGRQGSYGDLPPVDYRSAPNGYQGNSPPGSNSQSRQRQRSVTLPQHLPMKPPHRLNEPVTPRGNAGYPGQSYSEKFQQRLDQRDTQGGYGHNGSPTQIRGPPPAGPPSGYYGGHNDQNGPRYGSQSNSRRNSSGVYDDQDPVPTPRRKPGPTPDPIPRKSTTSQQVNPQGGTDEILDANSRLRNELDNINSEIQRNKGINELSRQIYDS
ncbi:uncharacterized protein LOC135482748 isoform X2 [Lineus longissimus]|uniref:uncharacterized protein LOC135482748 isoform X2 n=1 Tax=Lineus longissimus TaxID=88925 RepID=UPI00315DAB8D